MLKRVSTEQLRTGMFVQELAGSWMDHPFWRGKFMLKDPTDIARILKSGVKEAWIDVSRGHDVEGGRLEVEVMEEVEHELEFLASMPMPFMDEEEISAVEKAAALYRKSRPHMLTMFNEARMGRVNVDNCVPLVEEISQSVMNNPGALISIVRLKTSDEYTYMHSVAVCALMVSLARQLNMSPKFVREAGMAGMLHDLGKAVMPAHVLNKPGKLTDDEHALIRQHPERGHAMLLEGAAVSAAVLDVCLHHHEKVDGSGYPYGLTGDKISLLAKMGAVCDVYDAVTSKRPYKLAWNPGDALRKMAQWKGHFDPVVFQAFVKTVGIYPVGALVRLQSGLLAVVTEQSSHTLLKPKVNVFFNTTTAKRMLPELIDLGSPWCADKVIACEDPDKWGFKDLDKLWGAPDLS
jgi:HD-GYP domain-containing protein (c-di-GMP phosphodiesterase class II)